MFNINQFREYIVAPALNAIQIRSKEIEELLVFTCAVESAGGTYVKQIQGPALGIFQMEPNSFTDLWINYIIRKPEICNALSLNLNVHRMPDPNEMITNLLLAAALCGIYYQRKKVNPADCEEGTLWSIYKEFYNTSEGKAEKDASIKAYRKFIKA